MADPKPKDLENPGTEPGKDNPDEQTPPIKPVKGSGKKERKLKKQLKESSKEGIRLAKDNQTLSTKNQELKTELEGYKSSDEIPLDEERLKKQYPDWDVLDEAEKSRIKSLERLKIRQTRLEAEMTEKKKKDIKKEEKEKFQEEIKKALANPDFAEDLKGKEKEFEKFCYKDENLGTPASTLIKSFLFDLGKGKPDKPAKPGLEEPSGGDKPGGIPKEGYTLAEIDEMMKNDPKRHRRLVESGKLKIIDE